MVTLGGSQAFNFLILSASYFLALDMPPDGARNLHSSADKFMLQMGVFNNLTHAEKF